MTALSPARATGGLKQSSAVWGFGFQCNERYLAWDGSAQARLLKLHCAKQLDCSVEQVDEQLRELTAVLPGLTVRLDRIKAALLLRLLKGREQVAATLLGLRAEFPAANVEDIASRFPALLLEIKPDELPARARRLRDALSSVESIDAMIEREPRLLQVDVHALLAELERLVPDKDAQTFLSADPTRVMDMSSQGLRPSLEDEPGLQLLQHHSHG